jgi:hypothetical protein
MLELHIFFCTYCRHDVPVQLHRERERKFAVDLYK